MPSKEDIWNSICNHSDREGLTESLRILLACLVQQTRIEKLPPDTNPACLLKQESTLIRSSNASSFLSVDAAEWNSHEKEENENDVRPAETIPPMWHRQQWDTGLTVTSHGINSSDLEPQQQYYQQHEVLSLFQQHAANLMVQATMGTTVNQMNGGGLPLSLAQYKHEEVMGQPPTSTTATDAKNDGKGENDEEECCTEIDVLEGWNPDRNGFDIATEEQVQYHYSEVKDSEASTEASHYSHYDHDMALRLSPATNWVMKSELRSQSTIP